MVSLPHSPVSGLSVAPAWELTVACRRGSLHRHSAPALLELLLYYPPAAVTGGTGEIKQAAFTHYLACCGEHQAGHYLGLGLGPCLWSRGLSPLLPTYTLPLGLLLQRWGGWDLTSSPWAAHYPRQPSCTKRSMTSFPERLRALIL